MSAVARAGAVIALAALAGCANVAPGWWAGQNEGAALEEREAAALARDLVAVLVEEWPPAWTAVRLEEKEATPGLEEELRRAGYAIAADMAEDAVDVSATMAMVAGTALVSAGLAAGGDWRVDRLYARNAGGRLRPRSGYTIRGQKGAARALRSGTYAVVPRPEAPPDGGACALVRVERGSLRANAARLLQECGYRLGEWPGDAAHVRDWVVDREFAAEVDGVRGVLDLLRGYGLGARVRESDRTVDFEGAK